METCNKCGSIGHTPRSQCGVTDLAANSRKANRSPAKAIPIWERVYDNPLSENGMKKPNKLLGYFRIVQWIYGNMSDYECLGIGESEGKVYLIQGREVSYTNGGTRYVVTPLTDLVVKSPEATDE